MKHNRRFLAAMLAALMLVSACLTALAETVPSQEAETIVDTMPGSTVLATMDGVPVYKSECDDTIADLAEQGYTCTYRVAVDQVMFTRVLEKVMEEEGYLDFTEEEEAAFRAQAQEVWDYNVDQYVSTYLSEDTEEARAELRRQGEEYLYSLGYSVDLLTENNRMNAGFQRLSNKLVPPETVSDAAVEEFYQQMVAQQQAQLGDDVGMLELYQQYFGYQIYYQPAGYRHINHILLIPDQALLEAYKTAQSNYDTLEAEFQAQQQPAPQPAEGDAAQPEQTEAPAEPVTQEQLDEALQAVVTAREAVFASKQTELDDIESRLAAGETFESLIAQYNEDPGLDPKEGYLVHPESMMWDPVFRDAAFSAEMAKPGDHSLPVLGSYGIHVLYYLADAEAGPLPLTSELREQIRASLLNDLLQDALNNIFDERKATADIVLYDELIDTLDAVQTDDTEGEAVPYTVLPEEGEEPSDEPAEADEAAEPEAEQPAETDEAAPEAEETAPTEEPEAAPAE